MIRDIRSDKFRNFMRRMCDCAVKCDWSSNDSDLCYSYFVFFGSYNVKAAKTPQRTWWLRVITL